ncbi:MAG: amidohydrolase family protein [Schaedlerella sp.]|nr:amidohydrolase family protein [Schaedlerella sp.]
MIIDFHTHTFPDSIAEKVIHNLANACGTAPASNGTVSELLLSMKEASIDYSVSLPVMTNTKQVESINHNIIQQKEVLEQRGIIAFGGIHPDYENYKQELKYLVSNGIKGIKLHPAYQRTCLNDIKMLRIISLASELGLIILVHAGIDIGIYDDNYSSVPHILNVIKEVQPEKFVLAHMGNWGCWDAVEKDLAGAPVWFDSSFSIGPYAPYPGAQPSPYFHCDLPKDKFLRILRKHGTNKILFATDSPWQSQKDYVELFQNIGMTEEEQEQFFFKNACQLLEME